MTSDEIIKNIDIAIEASLCAGKEILKIYKTQDFKIQQKEDLSPLTIADKNSNIIIEQHLHKTKLPVLSEEGKEIDYTQRIKWEYFWLVDPLDGTKEFIKKNDEFTVNIALMEKDTPLAGVIYIPVKNQLYVGINKLGAYKVENANGLKKNNFANILKQGLKLPVVSKNKIYTIAGSRSHMNEETKIFIKQLKNKHKSTKILSKGSSLKICMVAEGVADIYPRFGPTMEWDTAAGHAIVAASGGKFTTNKGNKFVYNKKNLLNTWFIAKR